MLRLNQIAYVLGELSLYLGGNSDVIQAAMEIVSKHQDLARDAAADGAKDDWMERDPRRAHRSHHHGRSVGETAAPAEAIVEILR